MDRINEVRKSIVRISFGWKNDTEHMVTAGIIASIKDDGSCTIIASSIFFDRRRTPKEFNVNFPKDVGYESESKVLKSSLTIGENFITFVVSPKEAGYIKPINFATRPVETFDEVYAFIFPREVYITPTGFCRGNIVYADSVKLLDLCFQDSPFHEYAHFGAPVFNKYGNLVGICFNSQIRTHVWTVKHLKYALLDDMESISYVVDEEAG